jgi:hypothetical protein
MVAASITGEANHGEPYKGITYKKAVKGWHPQICKDGRQYSFGIWQTPAAAALMYDIASAQMHGEFGQTNGLIVRRDEIVRAERERRAVLTIAEGGCVRRA